MHHCLRHNKWPLCRAAVVGRRRRGNCLGCGRFINSSCPQYKHTYTVARTGENLMTPLVIGPKHFQRGSHSSAPLQAPHTPTAACELWVAGEWVEGRREGIRKGSRIKAKVHQMTLPKIPTAIPRLAGIIQFPTQLAPRPSTKMVSTVVVASSP